MNYKLLPVLAFMVCLAGMTYAAEEAAKEEKKVADISHEELVKAIKEKKVVLIDCNGTESYTAGHIPGAIDFAKSKEELAKKLPEDKGALVVAYCGNEFCVAYLAAATAAIELGYTNVKHYSPGIDGWKKSGAKVEKD